MYKQNAMAKQVVINLTQERLVTLNKQPNRMFPDWEQDDIKSRSSHILLSSNHYKGSN